MLTPLLSLLRPLRIQSVSVFLAHLSPPTRESYLQTLCEMMSRTSPSNWRPRELLASQLPALVGLFSEECLQTVLGPLCFALVEDCVSVVRDSAIPAFAPLLSRFADESADYRASLLSRLHVMATSDTYVRRQLYVRIAGSLSRPPSPDPSLFLTEVLPLLSTLSKDTVPNIRIALAQESLHFPPWVFAHPTGRQLLITLLTDLSRDVIYTMLKFRTTRPDLVESVAADLPPPQPAHDDRPRAHGGARLSGAGWG